MNAAMKHELMTRLVLAARTARELMTPNPVSIAANAPVREAVGFLVDKGFSAAPVIDEAGRPVGVLSRTDILVHDRTKIEHVPTATLEKKVPKGFHVENVDRTPVRDLMTPVVFSVTPETPVRKVIDEILSLKVHHLFVVDEGGVLVGVISAVDILKHLVSDLNSSE
jgi:CBS domain-containing protein